MHKLLSLLLIILVSISSEVASAGMGFEKGQRSTRDLNRDKYSKGPEIVELAKLQKGMVVADIFGGGGYYSEILNEVVGTQGKVYLHNNKAYMPYVVKELIARLENKRLPNVVRFDREVENLTLTANQLDAAFFILGYHDMYHTAEGWDVNKVSLLKQLSTAVKKDGKLVVVDHSAITGSKTAHSQELHRIDKQYVIDELSTYGFKLIKQSDLLANGNDTRMVSPFKPEMRRKTDRFLLIFQKR